MEDILDWDPDEVKKRLDAAITTNGKGLDSYNLRIDVDLGILKRQITLCGKSEWSFVKKLKNTWHDDLLLHPLIQLFIFWKYSVSSSGIMLKMLSFTKLCFASFLSYFAILSVDFTNCQLKEHDPNSTPKYTQDCLYNSSRREYTYKHTAEAYAEQVKSNLNRVLIVNTALLTILISNETLQYCYRGWRHFIRFENVLEILLYIPTIFFFPMWFYLLNATDPFSNTTEDTAAYLKLWQTIAAVLVFCAWYLCLLNGQTSFQGDNNYHIMFIDMMKKLFFFLVSLGIILIGFTFTFMILLKSSTFDLWDLIINFSKVMVMFTGEINFDEDAYDMNKWHNNHPMRYVGITILLLFLFIVNMVLSNLIIALAVDINQGEENSKIKAIKIVMARIEELEHVFLFLRKWKCRCHHMCDYMIRRQNWHLISRLSNLGIGGEYSDRISFFPNRPKDRFSIYLRCMLTPTNNPNNEENMIYLTSKPTYLYYIHKMIRDTGTARWSEPTFHARRAK